MVSADQTPVLREGYWASYNVPFYEEVFQLSGYADMVKKHGQDFSHDLAIRAKIFRRDQGKVCDGLRIIVKCFRDILQNGTRVDIVVGIQSHLDKSVEITVV